MQSLSVIMPSLNEEKNIEAAVRSVREAMKRYRIPGEIIIVDDGSRDATGRLADAMASAKDGIRVIHHDRPHGVGASFLDGVRKARCDAVIMVPGDNENNNESSLSFFPLMENVDIIIPFIVNREVRSPFRRALSRTFRDIINFTLGTTLNYTNGTVCYRRCILQGLDPRSTGFLYQAEILVKLIRAGYLYAEVPNFLAVRASGKSKAVSFKSLVRVTLNFIGLFFEVRFGRKRTGIHPSSVTAAARARFEKSAGSGGGKGRHGRR